MDNSLKKAFIFDFDGTLVDSRKTIRKCFQKVTEELAPDRVSYAKNILIGPALSEAASEILGIENQRKLSEFVKLFIEFHDKQAHLTTKPFLNVVKTLKKFHQSNIPMSIATNKRQSPTMKFIKYYGWEQYFKRIECSDSLTQNQNKGQMIKNILKLNPEFKSSFFVGDTISDALAAKKNELKFIKANYGYGKNQGWKNVTINKKIDNFEDLTQF